MSLLPSGLAGSGSQEEGARHTWTGGHKTREGERGGMKAYGIGEDNSKGATAYTYI